MYTCHCTHVYTHTCVCANMNSICTHWRPPRATASSCAHTILPFPEKGLHWSPCSTEYETIWEWLVVFLLLSMVCGGHSCQSHISQNSLIRRRASCRLCGAGAGFLASMIAIFGVQATDLVIHTSPLSAKTFTFSQCDGLVGEGLQKYRFLQGVV